MTVESPREIDKPVRSKGARLRRKRDASATRERILQGALSEFCEKGFNGARTASIAARARCNIRMLYHYFDSKEGLYLASLELVYARLRAEENALDLLRLEPEEGMCALMDFTYDYMLRHQEFIQMVGVENIQRGTYLRRSKAVPQEAMPLVKSIETLLARGQAKGIFRSGIDAVQLYVSILSLSYVHISNKHTLSITFRQDLTDPAWLRDRRDHVRDMILSFIRR